MKSTLLWAVAMLVALSVGCAAPPATSAASLDLTGPAFVEGATLPVELTCDGADLSPALVWAGVPQGTASLALICDDVDARGFVHWVLYGLSPTVTELAPGLPKAGELAGGARQGTNDFGRLGYGGPCPPKGAAHRYVFRLYALDAAVELPAGAKRADLEAAMKGHILAEGSLSGQYSRK